MCCCGRGSRVYVAGVDCAQLIGGYARGFGGNAGRKSVGHAAYNAIFHKIAHPAGVAECAVLACHGLAYFALQGIASIGIETIV